SNLLKNAQEAIQNSSNKNKKNEIFVKMTNDDSCVTIEIEDSGKGFPESGREKLTEPYITHRDKGTGLGLAIVKKIIEDHGGELRLSDSMSLGGAKIVMVFDKMWLNKQIADGDNPNGARHSSH